MFSSTPYITRESLPASSPLHTAFPPRRDYRLLRDPLRHPPQHRSTGTGKVTTRFRRPSPCRADVHSACHHRLSTVAIHVQSPTPDSQTVPQRAASVPHHCPLTIQLYHTPVVGQLAVWPCNPRNDDQHCLQCRSLCDSPALQKEEDEPDCPPREPLPCDGLAAAAAAAAATHTTQPTAQQTPSQPRQHRSQSRPAPPSTTHAVPPLPSRSYWCDVPKGGQTGGM